MRASELRTVRAFEKSKLTSNDTPPPARPTSSFYKIPTAGDQVFKQSLWGAAFSFRSPQGSRFFPELALQSASMFPEPCLL